MIDRQLEEVVASLVLQTIAVWSDPTKLYRSVQITDGPPNPHHASLGIGAHGKVLSSGQIFAYFCPIVITIINSRGW